MIVHDVIINFSHQYSILSGRFNLHKLNNELQIDNMNWAEMLETLTMKVEELTLHMNIDFLFSQMNTLGYSETQKMWLIFCFELTKGLEFNTINPAEFGIEVNRLPFVLFQLDLRKLNISHGKIPALPSINLPRFEEMSISIQTVIPFLFAPKLRKLELQNQEKLPDLIYLSSLKELILANCDSFPKFYPQELSFLDISGMNLEPVKLPNIHELRINMDQLKNLSSMTMSKYFIKQDNNPSGNYSEQTFFLISKSSK